MKTNLVVINVNADHLRELREAAIYHVKHGRSIVPVGCNKQTQDYKLPLIRWREEGPLTTEDEVNRTFNQLGGKIFGIATVIEGYTLVDFDTKDTPKIFNGLELAPTIKTGKGFHMWYAADEALKSNGPVDLREFEKRDGAKYQLEVYTKKRLDIIPPSLHHSGEFYEWVVPLEDFPELPKLPDSIASLCRGKKVSNESVSKGVPEGSRHSALVKVATKFGKTYKGNREKVETATREWNEKHCTPPLPDEEMGQVIDWVVENVESDDYEKRSKSKKLQQLLDADEDLVLFHDQNSVGYARICSKNRLMNVPIQSAEFKMYVRFLFFSKTDESISNVQLDEVLSLCEAKAIFEREQHELHHRVAQTKEAFYYDLCNEDGEVVKVDEKGWSVLPGAEVPFLFKVGLGKEQVRPVRGGSLKDLLPLINLTDPDEQMIFLSTLPVRFIREVDQAIAYVSGPAGSGKTTLLKMTKDLLDPSSGGISMPIKKVDDAVSFLSQSWVFANDNISRIDNELSDFLCVVATGAESSRRTLYTNSDITVFKLKNPAYLTGVNMEVYRSDLMSRLLLFKTEAVAIGGRRGANEIQAIFENIKPMLLGAIFDTLSQAIKVVKTLPHKTESRMADFALWGAACAEVLGYGAERFETAMQKSLKYGAYDSIHSFSAGRALVDLIEREGHFSGTQAQLLQKLKNAEDGQGWYETVASNPSVLGKKLRELENSFAQIGILIDFGKRTSKERIVVIKKMEKVCDGNDG